jgi:hypothetical protein
MRHRCVPTKQQRVRHVAVEYQQQCRELVSVELAVGAGFVGDRLELLTALLGDQLAELAR